MSHDLKYTTIVPAATPLGESTFAAARREIEARYQVSPVEVFLDGIQVEGQIQAGDLTIDLDLLKLRIITFGADAPRIAAPTSLAEVIAPEPSSDGGLLSEATTTTIVE